MGEPSSFSIGTNTTIGVPAKIKGKNVTFKLKRAIVADTTAKVAFSRRIGQRWRLCGYGMIKQ